MAALTLFMVVQTSQSQSYMWHKTGYGFPSHICFFRLSKAKIWYGGLKTTFVRNCGSFKLNFREFLVNICGNPD